jgi:hypothetical protein
MVLMVMVMVMVMMVMEAVVTPGLQNLFAACGGCR